MKKLNDRQWGDIGYKITNKRCPICGDSGKYTRPNYGEIGKIDVLTVSCCNCGHVEIYDVAELAAIADAIDKEYRETRRR